MPGDAVFLDQTPQGASIFFGFERGMFPVAEMVSDQTLSLPLASSLTDDEIDRVIEAVHECFA